MSLLAKENVSNIAPIPEGCFVGVCYSVVDIGTQFNEVYDKAARKVVVTWELPEHRIELERDAQKVNLPRAISKRYTLSLGEKAILRRDLTAWRGRAFPEAELKGFDMKKLLGAACQIQVIHTRGADKVYANVGALMALPKGVKAPPPENELLFFSLDEHMSADQPLVLPHELPEWVQKLIKESREWEKWTLKAQKGAEPKSVPQPEVGPAGVDDDVPF